MSQRRHQQLVLPAVLGGLELRQERGNGGERHVAEGYGLRVETEEVDVVTAALQQQLLLVLRACCVSQSVICVDFRLGCQQKRAVVLRMSAVG